MIPYGLLSQISLIVVAVALTMTYIKPMFVKISSVQDKISIYQEETEKVAAVNQTLDSLVKKVDSVSQEDQKRLLTYMPNEVDNIAVPRDIQAIAAEAGVVVQSINYEGPISMPNNTLGPSAVSAIEPHSFVVELESSYDQLKQVLSYLEQNHYPLEVTEMEVRKKEGGFVTATLKIVTYDRTPPPVVIKPALQ